MINYDEENRPMITRVINGETVEIPIIYGESEEISAHQKSNELYNQVVDALEEILPESEFNEYIAEENEEYLIELVEIIDEARHDLVNQNFELFMLAALYQLEKNGLSQKENHPNYKELISNSMNYSEPLIEEE